jgi:uncharacterized protein DUF6538
MSGPRPRHVTRRGALYAVRYRLPADLAIKLGRDDIQRSLGTADWRIAWRRSQRATAWFRATVEHLRAMPVPSRADLEKAAQAFFKQLVEDDETPRGIASDYRPEDQVALNVESSQARLASLEHQLRSLDFEPRVWAFARELVSQAGAEFDELDARLQTVAVRLAAQAERQELTMPPPYKAVRDNFARALSAKQAKVFPILRAAFAKLAGQQLWSQDIYVRSSGRQITYTAAIFAANANIAAAEHASEVSLMKLRFSRALYEWCRGCGGHYYYELQVPPDGAVGVWSGSEFDPVK